jgi:methylmalonyl-CoA mutase N-terminal domain/subunit
VEQALSELRRAAAGTANCLPPMRQALALRATGGEIANALRDVWGVYQPNDAF